MLSLWKYSTPFLFILPHKIHTLYIFIYIAIYLYVCPGLQETRNYGY